MFRNPLCIAEMLKKSRGNVTPRQVERCAQMSGGFGREIAALYSAARLTSGFVRDTNTKRKGSIDVLDFSDAYRDDRLWDKIPGRSHRMYRDIPEYPIPV